MEVNLAFLADAANITSDGSLNVLGIRQHINTLVTPFQYPHIAIIIVLKVTAGEKGTQHLLRVLLMDEDGKSIHPPVEMNFRVPENFFGTEMSLQLIGNVIGVNFPKACAYSLDIVLDNQSRKQLPLRVNFIAPPPGMLPPSE